MVMAIQYTCLLSHTGCSLRFFPSFFSDGSFCPTIFHGSCFLVCSHSVLGIFPSSILRNDKWTFSETSFVWKQKIYFIFTGQWIVWVSIEFWVRKYFPSESCCLLALYQLSSVLLWKIQNHSDSWYFVCIWYISEVPFVESSFSSPPLHYTITNYRMMCIGIYHFHL